MATPQELHGLRPTWSAPPGGAMAMDGHGWPWMAMDGHGWPW